MNRSIKSILRISSVLAMADMLGAHGYPYFSGISRSYTKPARETCLQAIEKAEAKRERRKARNLRNASGFHYTATGGVLT
jgi:hypothetical protein